MVSRYGLDDIVRDYRPHSYVCVFCSTQNQQIEDEFVVGTLPNNQSLPGGEAQLDVEYIIALAPGADLWFYSMAELYVSLSYHAV